MEPATKEDGAEGGSHMEIKQDDAMRVLTSNRFRIFDHIFNLEKAIYQLAESVADDMNECITDKGIRIMKISLQHGCPYYKDIPYNRDIHYKDIRVMTIFL